MRGTRMQVGAVMEVVEKGEVERGESEVVMVGAAMAAGLVRAVRAVEKVAVAAA